MKPTAIAYLASLLVVPCLGSGQEGLGTSTIKATIKISIDVERDGVSKPIMSVPELKPGDVIKFAGPIGQGPRPGEGWQLMIVFSPSNGAGNPVLLPTSIESLYRFPTRRDQPEPGTRSIWEAKVPLMERPIATFILVPDYLKRGYQGLNDITSKMPLNWHDYLANLGKLQKGQRDLLWTLDFLRKVTDPSASPAGANLEERIWSAFGNAGLGLSKKDFSLRLDNVDAIKKLADGLEAFVKTGKFDSLGLAIAAGAIRQYFGPWGAIAGEAIRLIVSLARPHTTYSFQMGICEAQSLPDQNLALHLTKEVHTGTEGRSMIVFSPLTPDDANHYARFLSTPMRVKDNRLSIVKGGSQAVAISNLARYIPRGLDSYWTLYARPINGAREDEIRLGSAELSPDGRFTINYDEDCFSKFPGHTSLSAVLSADVGFARDFRTETFRLDRVVKTNWKLRGQESFVAGSEATVTLIADEPTAVSSVFLEGLKDGRIQLHEDKELKVTFDLEDVRPGANKILINYPGIEGPTGTTAIGIHVLRPVKTPSVYVRKGTREVRVVPPTDVAHVRIGQDRYEPAGGEVFRGDKVVDLSKAVYVCLSDPGPNPRELHVLEPLLKPLPELTVTAQTVEIKSAKTHFRESEQISSKTDRILVSFSSGKTDLTSSDFAVEVASGETTDDVGQITAFSSGASFSRLKIIGNFEASIDINCNKFDRAGGIYYRLVDRKTGEKSTWSALLTSEDKPIYFVELPTDLFIEELQNGEHWLVGKKLGLLGAVGRTSDDKKDFLSSGEDRRKIDPSCLDGTTIYLWLRDLDDVPIRVRLSVIPREPNSS